MGEIRECKFCGCTDDDCAHCVERTGTACFWLTSDTCSACAHVVGVIIVEMKSDTYLAKWRDDRRGKIIARSSCTSGPDHAAAALAAKVKSTGRHGWKPSDPKPYLQRHGPKAGLHAPGIYLVRREEGEAHAS